MMRSDFYKRLLQPDDTSLVSMPMSTMQVPEMNELSLGGPINESEVAPQDKSLDNAAVDMYGKGRGGFGGNGKKSYDPYGH